MKSFASGMHAAGKMHDAVHSVERAAHRIPVKEIGRVGGSHPFDFCRVASASESRYFDPLGSKRPANMRADEPISAGDQRPSE